jgi:hypothetical protein
MKKNFVSILVFVTFNTLLANEDTRVHVELPKMMQNHMMANMRDHLNAISEILDSMAKEEFDKAGEIAENRLGMSSLNAHKAEHMGMFMPKQMAAIGTSMHKAASRFNLKVQEENYKEATRALSEVTKACVACHANYKIK